MPGSVGQFFSFIKAFSTFKPNSYNLVSSSFKSDTSLIVVTILPFGVLLETFTDSSFTESPHPPGVVPPHPHPQSPLDSDDT